MKSTEQDNNGLVLTQEAEKLLGTLIRLLNPYAQTMHYPRDGLPSDTAIRAEAIRAEATRTEAAAPAAAHDKLSQFHFEVDNRYGSQNGGEYLFWDFKGQPQTVKKAARIQYRHPVIKGGLVYWITDHLLVGFAGSDGP
jgi:hypothetical protein